MVNLTPRPRLVFRVGIVGHRPRPDIPFDVQAVHDSLAALFENMGRAIVDAAGHPYDSAAPPTFTLASSLAEGADQIAVRALKAADLPPGVERRVEALLPFAREDFAETFDTSTGRTDLAEYLSSADSVIELADWRPPLSPTSADERRRDLRYALAGELIMRHSDLLVAVWDGEPARGRGGTAETVAIALRQGKPVVWIDPGDGKARLLSDQPLYDDLFTSIADHAVPLSDMQPMKSRIESLLRPPPAPHDEKHAGSRSALDGFLEQETVPAVCWWTTYERWLVGPARRQLGKARSAEEGGAATTKPSGGRGLAVDYIHRALHNPAWKAIPDLFDKASKDRLIRDLGEPWAASDAIATKLGHVYRSIYVLVFALGALAVAFGLIGLFLTATFKMAWTEPLFSFLEFSTLLAACSLYWLSHVRDHHTRWMNARALGEQIRAHWALTLLGAGGRRELDAEAQWNAWLFNAYAGEIGLLNLRLTPAYLLSAANAMLHGIVNDQLQYHSNNKFRLALIHKNLERAGHILLISAIFICAILCCVSVWEVCRHLSGIPMTAWWAYLLRTGSGAESAGIFGSTVSPLLAICAAIFPTFGGALAAIRYQGDFERFSERSNKTANELSRLKKELEKFTARLADEEAAPLQVPHYEILLQIATDLERVLLSDLDDWRFVYRSRPIFSPG